MPNESEPITRAMLDKRGGLTGPRNNRSMLIAKLKPGGVFASVFGAPQNAGKYPSVKVVPLYAGADARVLEFMAEAVKAGYCKYR